MNGSSKMDLKKWNLFEDLAQAQRSIIYVVDSNIVGTRLLMMMKRKKCNLSEDLA